MMAKQKTYIAIDLKSFYASVECKEDRENHLPCGISVIKKLWDTRQTTLV